MLLTRMLRRRRMGMSMPKFELSVDDAREYIDVNGVANFVTDLTVEEVADAQLRALFTDAQGALDAITKYLDK